MEPSKSQFEEVYRSDVASDLPIWPQSYTSWDCFVDRYELVFNGNRKIHCSSRNSVSHLVWYLYEFRGSRKKLLLCNPSRNTQAHAQLAHSYLRWKFNRKLHATLGNGNELFTVVSNARYILCDFRKRNSSIKFLKRLSALSNIHWSLAQ